jgi:hypothetical protein
LREHVKIANGKGSYTGVLAVNLGMMIDLSSSLGCGMYVEAGVPV